LQQLGPGSFRVVRQQRTVFSETGVIRDSRFVDDDDEAPSVAAPFLPQAPG